jgi:hypothetical protein
MSDFRAMRIGTRVKAVFAAHGAAAEITCGLSRMQDHIVLEFLSAPRFIQRRRHERFDLRVAVDLAWRDHARSTWSVCHALTRDVSEGGARLVIAREGRPAVSAPVSGAVFLMAVPGGGETSARALHVDGEQIGAEFLQPPKGFFDNLLKAAGPPRPGPGSR